MIPLSKLIRSADVVQSIAIDPATTVVNNSFSLQSDVDLLRIGAMGSRKLFYIIWGCDCECTR